MTGRWPVARMQERLKAAMIRPEGGTPEIWVDDCIAKDDPRTMMSFD